MDDIKRTRVIARQLARSAPVAVTASAARRRRLALVVGRYRLVVALPAWRLSLARLWRRLERRYPLLKNAQMRVCVAVTALIIILAEIISIVQPLLLEKAYALGDAESLLLPISQPMADELKFDAKQQAFDFNGSYAPADPSSLLGSSGNQATAQLYQDLSKGVTTTDPVNHVDFSLTPQFSAAPGKQDGNRVVYPFGGQGWLAYSVHAIGVKEDILLTQSRDDVMAFDYSLELGDNLAARVESNGSVGIYGNTLLSGNVATSTAKDAELLQKARQNAPKNTLLFSLPAPYVKELGVAQSAVRTKYVLEKNTLSIVVSGLDRAHYPLTIDPSIYVVTAANFMRGNNETNIDFDVADKLIRKGPTTGARFNSWTSTTSLNTSIWQEGVAAAGGFIYTVGGIHPGSGSATYTTVGSDTFLVPTGVTSITVKTWGAGGGGGGGGQSSGGGAGGGGGFAQAAVSTTPGETLNVFIGGGGGFGGGSGTSGAGGGGGGYSGVFRSTTPLIIGAGGAGGGGGGRGGSSPGGAGGAGGGTTGVTGGAGTGGAGAGTGGTPATGGTAGSGGGNAGTNGGSLTGGPGGDGRSAAGADGGANNGGTNGGAAGGINDVATRFAGGGGGGAGLFGGGGGSGGVSQGGAGAGGGGSSMTTGTGTTNTAGSGTTPGNNGDTDRGTAGTGGNGGGNTANGTVGNSGIVVITYTAASSASTTVSWAQFNTSTGTIDNANPGSGACSGWCAASAYNLPAARSALSLVAYNGFLYAIGGEDSSCTSGAGTGDTTVCKTVYIAKLGANGEPQLWHPTDRTQANWVYWYRDTDLSTPRSFTAAVAYNNRMYLLGGKTSSSGVVSIVNTMQIADITPTGKLGTWATSGATLPTNRFGHDAQVYNDRLYLIGGGSSVGGAPLNTVYYNKINNDGTLNSWVQTSSFSTGRMTNGGNFTAVWGAYIYISSGCSAVNGSGYCTTVASDTQLASINADGSLDVWNTNASVSDSRMSHNIVTWRNAIYEIGGCTAQDGATGNCTTATTSIKYGTINQDGDASTVNQSSPSGTAPCSGGSPTSCDLPSASVGNVLNETAIMNGYLYIMGGCTNNACTAASTGVTYQSISSSGALQKPATCTGTFTDSYCVSSSSLPTGLAAAGTAVFQGRIYLIGGFTTGTNIYFVSVNTDGSLGAWSGATSIASVTANPSTTTLTYPFAYARANPSSAGANPGNLYIIGGCTDGVVGCSGYSQGVYKCNISTSGSVSGCDTTGQLQIGTITGATGTGLGAMAGAVYANYIYLIGGLAPSITDLKTARYAKIDNNNNIVTVGSGWVEGANQTQTGRRRGAGFGYNGYLYVVGGYDGTSGGGVLADIEFAKINVSNGSWGAFTTSSVTINQRWGLSVPVSSSYAYVVGGCTAGASPSSCTTRTNTTQTFQIYNNDSGSPGGYSNAANTYATNPNRIGVASAVYNGFLYAAGGCTGTNDGASPVTTVSYSSISSSGALAAWSNTTAALPAARAWGQLLVAGGNLYYLGGQDSNATAQTTVYYAAPSAGDVSSWNTATNGLPAARTKFGGAVWNNRLYVVGGLDATPAVSATVYVSPQQSAGGNIISAWSTSSTSVNVARYSPVAVTYANNLYIFGGNDGTNYLNDSQYSQINSSTGDAGSWTYTTSLPTQLAGGSGFAQNGYMYLFGGRSSSGSCRPITLVAPISANSTIASGNNPTGVGEWFETNSRYAGSVYGNAASYSDGKAYVLGGACASGTAPTVSGTPTTSMVTTDSTTHNVTMPAATASGDLLLTLLTTDGNTTLGTTPAGWQIVGTSVVNANNQLRATVFAKIADGTEGGTSVNFPTSAGEKSAAIVYRILAANWYGSITNGIDEFGISSGNVTNPNPPALDPANWDTENTLWIAYTGGSTYTSVTSAPGGFGSTVHINSTTTDTTGASASSATLAASVSSEDPGTFTMGPSAQDSVAFTIGVRPPLTYNGANEVQQTALLSQPQVAKYSIMFDTDNDVFPTIWLLNGLDNSIGARWQLSYRSMADTTPVSPQPNCASSPMATWGQTTNFGNVTLGTPGAYTPLDGSGTNTNCARYFYFLVTVDSSQAYGYPDDVTRGPTITDLTLGFTANPSKRLMHGRTFIEGLQQPDDTPCHQSAYAACPLP